MTHSAATATDPAATLPLPSVALIGLLLAALAWLLGYAAACAAAPFGRCRRCAGEGKIRPRIGRKRRHCQRCDGTGLRLRIGRRAFNYARRLHHGGSR